MENKNFKEIDPYLIFGPIEDVHGVATELYSMMSEVFAHEWPYLRTYTKLI